ncbi:MAG: AbrB/MazE/SpoVT family DNA-binding domain-containing protein [Nitrococcus sp.]|nr:AbrB/MazE/SpoVT family DNA-binding domain-containing protein [Nitrococcus sp.]
MSPAERRVRLFRNGHSQALRIPREFELPGDEATLRQEDGRLVIEPVGPQPSLLETLATMEPLDVEFPDVDEGLHRLDDVKL